MPQKAFRDASRGAAFKFRPRLRPRWNIIDRCAPFPARDRADGTERGPRPEGGANGSDERGGTGGGGIDPFTRETLLARVPEELWVERSSRGRVKQRTLMRLSAVLGDWKLENE